VILSCLAACENIKNRRNSFEFYGYDFLVDENCKPWLIEVNSSPAMDYSTVNNYINKLIESN
jgi:tubulin monoglycylase TTLL3/8